ncbi:MAG TPA: sugar O-acetyltransferase [Acidimicrobiales bacterium]|nr:sugar O-acetyltransferase [Acidimicrobiales bacterium]
MTEAPDFDRRSHYERMLAGDPYIADDPRIVEEQAAAHELLEAFNATPASEKEERARLLSQLLGSVGRDVEVRAPLFCDFGSHITIGDRTFVNFGLMALDVARIVIGDDCQIGPNVQLLTPTHPLDSAARRAKWEGAKAITIGDNVWLGGGVIILPGVTIGQNSVIGAGSVVTRDVPGDVLAVGNPARVIRQL